MENIYCHLKVDIFGSERNVLMTTGWIAMKFGANIYIPDWIFGLKFKHL